MKTWIAVATLTLAAGAYASPAETDTCSNLAEPGVATGPIQLDLEEVGFRSARRACHRNEISLAGAGSAAIDTPDFYGALLGTAALSGSYVLNPRFELFGTLEAFQLRFVQNASLKTTSTGLGQLTAGASWQALQRERWTVSTSARLMLPTRLPSHNAWTAGLSAGASAQWRAAPWTALHGYLGADVASGVFGTPGFPQGGFLTAVGAELSPWKWAAAVIDLQARFGERGAFDWLAPALELRFGGRSWGLSAGGAIRLAGPDRHDFAGKLGFAWRLE